jgi:hypothetical protein
MELLNSTLSGGRKMLCTKNVVQQTKRLMKLLMAFVVVVAMSGIASAQRGQGKGKPAATGVERAESVASPHGQRGLENAETKQAEHKDKHNSKHKKHRHSH